MQFLPLFTPFTVRLVATLTPLNLYFLPVWLPERHHLHYSCPFADPTRWPPARKRFYFYFLSDPCSFSALGPTFLYWTPNKFISQRVVVLMARCEKKKILGVQWTRIGLCSSPLLITWECRVWGGMGAAAPSALQPPLVLPACRASVDVREM